MMEFFNMPWWYRLLAYALLIGTLIYCIKELIILS